MIFPGHKYYPSTDPVNALLSLGYSFVARQMESLLESVGIDPAIGFLDGAEEKTMKTIDKVQHSPIGAAIDQIYERNHRD